MTKHKKTSNDTAKKPVSSTKKKVVAVAAKKKKPKLAKITEEMLEPNSMGFVSDEPDTYKKTSYKKIHEKVRKHAFNLVNSAIEYINNQD